METIRQMVLNHILSSCGVVAFLAASLARIDSVIKFALRFVSADWLKAELDRANAAAKAEVDKVNAEPKP